MCPPPFFGNSFKTSTPFIDTVINETLWEVLPLGDYRSFQFFHRLELSLVVDLLLKSIPNSVIHGINIRAIWRPHLRLNKVDMLFFQIVHCGPASVRWRSMSTCNDDISLWYQAADGADPSRGQYCSSMSCYLSLQNRWRPPLSSPYEILRPTP